MKNPLQTFEPNLLGRDFVIGDLHGNIRLFNKFLAHINFDEAVDRIFSVGDLVDRGEDSLGCLKLITKDWFKAVLANHEQMMIDRFRGGYSGAYWFRNGGEWGRAAVEHYEQQKRLGNDPYETATQEQKDLFDLITLAEELPYLITVKMKDGKRFHIVHAELPPQNKVTDADLEDPEKVRALAKIEVGDGECMIWGRYIFGPIIMTDLGNVEKINRTIKYRLGGNGGPFNDKLSHIISGHTILHRPVTVLGQTDIDTHATGATETATSRWAALTAVELGTWKFYQTSMTDFREVEPLVVDVS